MEKDERNKLMAEHDALDREYEEVKREALAPVMDRLNEIDERKDAIMEKIGAESVGKCIDCETYLFEGDKGYSYTDEIACADCAPTWRDIKVMLEKEPEFFEEDGIEGTRSAVAAHELDGTLDTKVLYTL